ncbi:hypothetical protein [Deinococcus sp.]|uniref:hypothetical protein n=1 Tax=Deinococcus sp. TaxID=47478 RepID=UPI003C7E7941
MSGVRVQVGGYSVQLWREDEPAALALLLDGADLSEIFETPQDGDFFAVSISQDGAGSLLTVTQHFSPSVPGFEPGVLIVPETNLALIGAGERLLAYDLKRSVRLWEDTADVGFWWWDRAGEVILMAAELELAAWNLEGRKLWSTFVEPPWFYWLDGDTLHLNVMDYETQFPVHLGPLQTGPESQ